MHNLPSRYRYKRVEGNCNQSLNYGYGKLRYRTKVVPRLFAQRRPCHEDSLCFLFVVK